MPNLNGVVRNNDRIPDLSGMRVFDNGPRGNCLQMVPQRAPPAVHDLRQGHYRRKDNLLQIVRHEAAGLLCAGPVT